LEQAGKLALAGFSRVVLARFPGFMTGAGTSVTDLAKQFIRLQPLRI
jgi:hypothetical protein